MILLFLLGISQIIIAETTRPGPAMRDPLRDIENTQRLLEMRRQQEYINQQLMYPNKNETEKEESKLGFEEGKKYLFTDITVIGSKLFKNEMDKIIAEYINTEMNEQDIYELLVKLSNVFLTKGYVTTLVTLKYGNINEGQLIYEVKEGKVRNIKMTGKEETTLDKIKLKLAFPMKKGDLLTTQDMDQGLENINVGGYNNMTEIAPTEEYGYSDILIEENYTSTGFSVGMDDSGYKDKGRNKININFSQDNLFGINDRLTLNYIERLTDDRKLDKEANYDIGYSVPIGYWRISYNYNMGDNYNTTISDLGSYKNKSRSKKHKLKVSKIISRG